MVISFARILVLVAWYGSYGNGADLRWIVRIPASSDGEERHLRRHSLLHVSVPLRNTNKSKDEITLSLYGQQWW
ncbi:hypothetical protein Bca4012_005329 [Brassica carinata]